MPSELPSGTVTFVFTDVDGSTQLLDQLGPDTYAAALAEHRRVIRDACAHNGGVEVDTQGDAFFFAFPTAPGAFAAASAFTEALEVNGPIRVRVGLHTGTPLLAAEGYVGHDVHRAARIAAAGHGGQVLVSAAAASLLPAVLRDLGEHRFKDLSAPERVYQLGERDFPPLRSLGRSNLPVPSFPLVGRAAELARIEAHVRSGVRLVTLTGPGGSGKTRLAIQAAGELAEDFVDGVFFVALAPLRDTSLAPGAIADALGVAPDENLSSQLEGKEVLLVLDNAEHLEGIEQLVAELLGGEPVFIVTSRAPLHLTDERELPVEPLSVEAAGELFAMRAAAAGKEIQPDSDVRALCARLDNLPLAVELAAARTKVLSPGAMLQRLDHALPFLTGGPSDAPERQRTLTATIEWSHDLLSAEEQAGFRRLAAFRGGFSLDAAEAVADTNLGVLESLVDQSLLKAVDDRFLMLETIREFADDQLQETGEAQEVGVRHARFYLARLEEFDPVLRGPRAPELLAWYDRETQNTWAALDYLLAGGEAEPALRLGDLLSPYWIARSRMEEGVRGLERAIEGASARTVARGRALRRMGDLLERLGRPLPAVEALHAARAIAEETGDLRGLCLAERDLAWTQYRLGKLELAVVSARASWSHARQLEDERLIATAGADLATFLAFDEETSGEAQRLGEAAVAYYRRVGAEVNVVAGLANVAAAEMARGDLTGARRRLQEALEVGRRIEAPSETSSAAAILGSVALEEGDPDEAASLYRESLELALEHGAVGQSVLAIEGIAFAASRADARSAARLVGAARATREERELHLDPLESRVYRRQIEILEDELGKAAFEEETSRGADTLSFEDAAALALQLAPEVLADR